MQLFLHTALTDLSEIHISTLDYHEQVTASCMYFGNITPNYQGSMLRFQTQQKVLVDLHIEYVEDLTNNNQTTV